LSFDFYTSFISERIFFYLYLIILNLLKMKTRILLLLVTFMFILPAQSYGQVGNLLKNKLNRVVNAGVKAVDKHVDAEIDTAVTESVENTMDKADARADSIRESKEQSQNEQSQNEQSQERNTESASQGSFNFGSLMANKVDLKHNEEYSFTSRIYMQTETYDDKDVVKMDFFMFYSATSPCLGIETQTADVKTEEGETVPLASKMVMDGENKCFIALTDMNGMKMGMISAIPDENTTGSQDDDKNKKKDNPPTFTKTGNTKVIAGYQCEEYSYVDPDDNTTGKVWFTKDAKLKIDKRGWNNTGMAAYYGNNQFNEGIILASESYDKKGKLTTKSETKEINENYPHSISVKGYSLRQINMGQGKKN
jgi:hypothetical protein